MPGAFHSEGVHPGMFRPPPSKSPCSASNSGYLPSTRTSGGIDDNGTFKRKRFRDDGFSKTTPAADDRDDLFVNTMNTTPNAGRWGGRHYTLAGQLDTPGGDGAEMMGESMYSDSDYRRMLGSKRSRAEADLTPAHESFRSSIFPPSMTQEQSQLQTAPAPSTTWGSFAVSVVGRLWQFCTVGTFKGFHAGGGRGYEMKPSMDDVSMFQDDYTGEQKQNPYSLEREGRQVPGYFPPGAEDTDPYAGESRSSSPAGRPAAKRRQTRTPNDDLGNNWVMVGDTGVAESSPARRQNTSVFQQAAASPRNRNSRPSVTTGRRISTPNVRRSVVSRPSLASTPTVTGVPQLPASTASSASYASPRPASPSKIPVYTPSSSFSPTKQAPARRTLGGPTTSSHRRTNSAASLASGRVSTTRRNTSSAGEDDHHEQHVDSSPRLSVEAKKLAARRRREADDADVRMSVLNQQLQDMIRQGKEALGTRIEVDGDGGWEDDDYQ